MNEMLPMGVTVTVTPTSSVRGPAYRARIVGYNPERTKYHLGAEVAPGQFAKGGSWALPGEVQPTQKRRKA
jgi:hypothetical protein